MSKITALKLNSIGRSVKVFVDGSFSFIADRKAIDGAGLKVGQDLSVSQVEALKRAFLSQNCLDAALRYLSYRPRSETEVRQRLRQRGFDDDVVVKTMNILEERGLVDDVAFAQFWKGDRLSFSPRSRKLVQLELRQKGVSAELAAEVTGDLDDETSAYTAGLKRVHSLASLDYDEFRRRLFGYLRRRGFGYEVVSRVVERLWHERENTTV